MAIVVRPFAAWSRAACTTFSELESRADVASSSRRTLGLRRRARAMAIRSTRRYVSMHEPANCEKDRLTLLATRQLGSFASHVRLETAGNERLEPKQGKRLPEQYVLGKRLNEFQDVSVPASSLKLLLGNFIRRLDGTEEDVEANCTGIQRGLLRH